MVEHGWEVETANAGDVCGDAQKYKTKTDISNIADENNEKVDVAKKQGKKVE